MDLSFEAAVKAIEQLASPAPDLFEGFLEAPQGVLTSYDRYISAGFGSSVDLDGGTAPAPSDQQVDLSGADFVVHSSSALTPNLPSVAHEAGLASMPSPRNFHELGAADAAGNVSLSMIPSVSLPNSSALSMNADGDLRYRVEM